MCGICGWVSTAGSEPASVAGMIAPLRPRGPDDEGIWKAKTGQAVLGHTRLKIIDLDASTQPMLNEDGQVAVVFNGEIYNYKELRGELIQLGHELRTRGDTETLIHLYEEAGPKMVDRLDGIFAFAIYDQSRHSLFLARDRVGVKPLYYWSDPVTGDLCFASTLPSLLASGRIPTRINHRALAQYLHFGYAIHPQSWIEGVRLLQPGEMLFWQSGRCNVSRYFDWRYEPEARFGTHANALGGLRENLELSVQSQLVADVKLGSFLSGGIDSTIVTGLAQRQRRQSGSVIDSFTVAFWSNELDESKRARSIAAELGTNHREINAQDLKFSREFIDHIVRSLGEPFGDTSALAQYILCENVSAHATVALSGDGGDELFFGYNGLRKQRLARLFRAFPKWSRKLILSHTHGGGETFGPRLNKYVGLSLLDDVGLIIDWARRWDWHTLEKILDQPVFERLFPTTDRPFPEVRAVLEEAGSQGDFRERQLAFHMNIDLPCDCLFKVDRMSMANGLEVRVPMLSNRMLEFGRHLPLAVRTEWRRTKEPLRSLGETLCSVLKNPAPKQGFSFPLDEWLRTNLAPAWREWELSRILGSLGFNRRSLDALIAEYDRLAKGPTSYRRRFLAARLFDLVLLARWVVIYGVQG